MNQMIQVNKYKECFLYSAKCGAHQKNVTVDGTFSTEEIDKNILLNKNEVNEKELIQSRVGKLMPNTSKVCAYHRYFFGTLWRAPTHCVHPLHEQAVDWRKAKKLKNLRPATLDMYNTINSRFPLQFPMFGNLCTIHRKNLLVPDVPEDANLQEVDDPEYIVNTSQDQSTLQDLHELTRSTNISPLKFRLTSPVNELSDTTLRYQKRKYKEFKTASKKRYKEMLAPGQEKELSGLISSTESDEEENVPPDLKFLLQAYDKAESEKQKTLIVSAVPKESYSQTDIMRHFSCSKHRVQMARKWQNELGALNYETKRHDFRNKLNMDSAEHFLTFLFEGDLIQDVAYGVSNMTFDDGTKQTLPKSILKLSRSHTIAEYKKHCEYFEFETLSNSTLWRILSAIKPGQKHAMAGLDNITTSGISGFETLKQTIVGLDIDRETKAGLQKDLESSKKYLKTLYPVHCLENSSIATHCIYFAVFNQKDDDFQPDHEHEHDEVCDDCLLLFVTLEKLNTIVGDLPTTEAQCEIIFDITQAVTNILNWMKHIIRGVQQDKAKVNAFDSLQDASTGFWLSDWAQKVLPSSFRECQREYFGKKGMSVHVDVLFIKNADGSLIKKTYFTALTRCDQDVIDTLCVADHVIKQIRADYPHLRQLYHKSDNAGCYAGNSVAENLYHICQLQNIDLLRYDYNEPQRGKDQADRDSAVAKRFLSAYIHSGNNCLSAEDIKKGILHLGGPKNASVSVAEIDKTNCQMSHSTIPNIQSFHSVLYHKLGMVFWQYFECGAGKFQSYQDLTFTSGLKVVDGFSEEVTQSVPVTVSKKRLDRTLCQTIFCSQAGCSSTFQTQAEADLHILSNKHNYHTTKSSMDKVKVHYAKLLHESSNTIAKCHHQAGNTSKAIPVQSKLFELLSAPGWALPKRSNVRFSLKQRKFLYEEFMAGETTGKKQTPEGTVKKMRSLRDENNVKMFIPGEYLTKEQIASMFSRMTRDLKLGKLSVPKEQCDTPDENVPDTPDDTPDENVPDTPDENVPDAMERIREQFTIATNDFVCISFTNEKKKSFRGEHFVGQVTTVDDDMVQISYLNEHVKYFSWPVDSSESWVSLDEIHLKLAEPCIDRRLHLIFSNSDTESIKECCR
jgi:hypothetical protein